MQFQKQQVYSRYNDVNAEPRQVKMRIGNQAVPQAIRHVFCQPNSNVIGNGQDNGQHLITVLIFNRNRTRLRRTLQNGSSSRQSMSSVIIIVLYTHEKTEVLLRHGLYNNSLYHSLTQKKTDRFRQCLFGM